MHWLDLPARGGGEEKRRKGGRRVGKRRDSRTEVTRRSSGGWPGEGEERQTEKEGDRAREVQWGQENGSAERERMRDP